MAEEEEPRTEEHGHAPSLEHPHGIPGAPKLGKDASKKQKKMAYISIGLGVVGLIVMYIIYKKSSSSSTSSPASVLPPSSTGTSTTVPSGTGGSGSGGGGYGAQNNAILSQILSALQAPQPGSTTTTATTPPTTTTTVSPPMQPTSPTSVGIVNPTSTGPTSSGGFSNTIGNPYYNPALNPINGVPQGVITYTSQGIPELNPYAAGSAGWNALQAQAASSRGVAPPGSSASETNANVAANAAAAAAAANPVSSGSSGSTGSGMAATQTGGRTSSAKHATVRTSVGHNYLRA